MSTEDIVMATDTGLQVVRTAVCAPTAHSLLSLLHLHRVIWLRVIGSVVIITLWGAVLLLQPGGLKREGTPLVLSIPQSARLCQLHTQSSFGTGTSSPFTGNLVKMSE